MQKLIGILICCLLAGNPLSAQTKKGKMKNKNLSYLAIGDSYTIGEGVSSEGNFPNQLEKEMASLGTSFSKPTIIAKTGWTTDELKSGIAAASIDGQVYDLVTLLIGVNNQYRSRPVENFQIEFEEMLQSAIIFAGGKKERVIVVSIPDWGVTPFAIKRNVNQEKVAKEIDQYNAAKLEICRKYKVQFVDITTSYRTYGDAQEMLAEDQLHPSDKVYKDWVEKISSHLKILKW